MNRMQKIVIFGGSLVLAIGFLMWHYRIGIPWPVARVILALSLALYVGCLFVFRRHRPKQ